MDEAYYEGTYAPVGGGPEPVRPPLSGRRLHCGLCGIEGVARVVRFRGSPADEVAVGPLCLCTLCSDLLASDPSTLGHRLQAEKWDFLPTGEAVARYLQQRMAEVIDVPRPSPDLQRLLEDGFEPIGELTGPTELVQVWPEQHRASLRDTNSRTMEDDGLDWLVRSPWPGIELEDVLLIVLRWVERDRQARHDEIRRARAAEALSWTKEQALAHQRQA